MASKARQSVFGGFLGLSLNLVIFPFFMRLARLPRQGGFETPLPMAGIVSANLMPPPAGPIPFRTRSAIAHLRPAAASSSSAERWCDRATGEQAPTASFARGVPPPESSAGLRGPGRDRRGRRAWADRRTDHPV